MRRPVGVILAAVVLGCIALFGILGCLLTLAVTFFLHNPIIQQAPGVRTIVGVLECAMLVFFLWCVWTVVGLFRMKLWARLSIIVIGGIVFVLSALAALGTFLARGFAPPLPAGSAPVNMQAVFIGVALFYFCVSLIGVWWLVYFNLPSVRAAFAPARVLPPGPGNGFGPGPGSGPQLGPGFGTLPPPGASLSESAPPAMSGWRLVIIVWACLLLACVLAVPMILVTPMPYFIAGVVLGGSVGKLVLLLLLSVEIWLGIGLLRKWKAAWYVAVAWQVYSAFYLLTFLLPGVWRRFAVYQEQLAAQFSTLPGSAPPASLFEQRSFFVCAILFGLGIIGVCTTALFRRKADFLGRQSSAV